jgi:manganese/zinc/iron transport system permease protein
MDPYFDSTFFHWFAVLLSRLVSHSHTGLFPDEIQLLVMVPFAVSASYLGVLLVLKRLTMMTNALSHTMLLGIVLALMMTNVGGEPISDLSGEAGWAIIIASVIVGLLTAFLTQQLTRVRFIREDASNGMVFTALFALAVTILSIWSRNAHIGPELLMGNPDALQAEDIPVVWCSSLLVLIGGVVCLRGFSVAIFDPEFARMSNARPTLFIHLLLAAVAVTSISAFRAVGFVMTLSFFVLPALVAQLWTKSLRARLLCACSVGAGTVVFSVALGRHLLTAYSLPVSTGALTATMLASVYFAALVVDRGLSRCCFSNEPA